MLTEVHALIVYTLQESQDALHVQELVDDVNKVSRLHPISSWVVRFGLLISQRFPRIRPLYCARWCSEKRWT